MIGPDWYLLSLPNRLAGVDPLLSMVTLMTIAHTNRPDYFYRVASGRRTLEEQKKLLKAGATKTLNSKHIVGLAVDIAIIHDGAYEQAPEYYETLADHMRRHFHIVRDSALFDYAPQHRLVWGGDWKMRDLGHFELA